MTIESRLIGVSSVEPLPDHDGGRSAEQPPRERSEQGEVGRAQRDREGPTYRIFADSVHDTESPSEQPFLKSAFAFARSCVTPLPSR